LIDAVVGAILGAGVAFAICAFTEKDILGGEPSKKFDYNALWKVEVWSAWKCIIELHLSIVQSQARTFAPRI